MKEKIQRLVSKYLPDVIKHRRYIHQNPELGFQEHNTTKYIKEVLEGYGFSNLKYAVEKSKTGIYFDIDSNKPGKTVMFRADIDALSLTELSDLEYKSKNPNVAHMCGHDGHTANLLGVAAILNEMKDDFKGKVRILFQPAEEGPDPGGAYEIMQEGKVLEGVDNAFGFHTYGAGDFGKVYFKKGDLYSSFIDFKITIKSVGGHCSEPHKCADPVFIASKLVVDFQPLISRLKEPNKGAVLAVGTLHAGSSENVIPVSAEMSGTIRVFDIEFGRKVVESIKELVRSTCSIYGAEFDWYFYEGYPPLNNDKALTEFAMSETKKLIGSENVKEVDTPKYGVEDFSYYAQKVPSCYFQVGIHKANEPEPLHHSGTFKWDDSVLAVSMGVSVNLLIKYLNSN